MKTSAGRIGSGRELVARKAELPHGTFELYCESLGIEKRFAERCMLVFDKFGRDPNTASKLSFSLLCDLSAQSVPQRVRDEIIVRLKGGEHLAPKVVRQTIEEATKADAGGGASKVDRKHCQKAEEVAPPDEGKNARQAVEDASQEDRSYAAQTSEVATQVDGDGGEENRGNAAQNENVDAGESGSATSRGTAKDTTETSVGDSQEADAQASELSHGSQYAAADTRALARSAVRDDSLGRSNAECAIAIIGELGHEKMLELGQALKGVDDTKFMRLLRERCTPAE
ncbi:hypothetical protein DK389_03030 [Methylobacterium durans]|uniref:DUF3102 domain-containing protein n=2 Tax=Methylobacterium durans TaxID=2202825 RepID=A0A2U8W0X2_9HYPH|nr:hypothetical protein DK389_03030 [Methylobacterium durans]